MILSFLWNLSYVVFMILSGYYVVLYNKLGEDIEIIKSALLKKNKTVK